MKCGFNTNVASFPQFQFYSDVGHDIISSSMGDGSYIEYGGCGTALGLFVVIASFAIVIGRWLGLF